MRERTNLIAYFGVRRWFRGNERLARGHTAQSDRGEEGSALLRHGTIYDRLDRARQQRVKSLATPKAANDTPKPRARSKSHLLPPIKDQEVFDPPRKEGLHPVVKLAIGAIAFAIMAGFTLLDWRASGPLTEVSAPTNLSPETADTQLPQPDAPTRIADAPKVESGTSDVLPAMPTAPSESPKVEVQQDATPLTSPEETLEGTVATSAKN